MAVFNSDALTPKGIEAAIDVALVTLERDRDNLSVDAGGVHGICDVSE